MRTWITAGLVLIAGEAFPQKDTSNQSKEQRIQPYEQVITPKAITDKGLFMVHQVGKQYFLEIPNALFNRDILIVTRLAKGAAGNRVARKMEGYAGDHLGESVIEFTLQDKEKVFLRKKEDAFRSIDSSENGLYHSLARAGLAPIETSFNIRAFRPDSSAVVIDITKYLESDNPVFAFGHVARTFFEVNGYEADKSYITSIRAYPSNVEVHTVRTYTTSYGEFTYELNNSIILLPIHPMKPRFHDPRVGYFAKFYYDFDQNPFGVSRNDDNTHYICRWRMEPKAGEIEKYKRGELVEPEKPIVFYIDPATPKKWVPYLIQGVNDWQAAFEKAGFRNAIYALEAPVNDPEWSIDDARHNVINYKPSVVRNASGPHVNDPRTGEILESHIEWYHNVMQLLHDWYFIQAGAIDAKATGKEFDDELMGKLIRFVCAHEVGHTLGLEHNFHASSTIPVDSLRNKKWVEEHGFCPSIMDYARFNYVAQPADSIGEKGMMPRIGVYDEWAIEWGYRWFDPFKTKAEERAYFQQWISKRTAADKRLVFGGQWWQSDPRNQSEDLGDDAVKAGAYGIKNLQQIMQGLLEKTKIPGEDYTYLRRMEEGIILQFRRYLHHTLGNISGYYYSPKLINEPGGILNTIPREKQQAVIPFLQQQLFQTPAWILDEKIFRLTGGHRTRRIITIQRRILDELISESMFTSMSKFNAPNGKPLSYTFPQLLKDLQTVIWSELIPRKPIGYYRRALQKNYADALTDMLAKTVFNAENAFRTDVFNFRNDGMAAVKGQVRQLITAIDKALPIYKDRMSQLHLQDVRDRLQQSIKATSE